MQFPLCSSLEKIEESNQLQAMFYELGLIPIITQYDTDLDVFMSNWINQEAFAKTIDSGMARNWSRARR